MAWRALLSEVDRKKGKWSGADLNRRHADFQSTALPTELPDQRRLSLNSTAVTDVGLAHLKGLTKLQTLDINSTKVTKAGVAALQKALPNCKIKH